MTTDWRAKLREKGYRLTPQRELILNAVDTLGHATPDEVLAEVRKHSDAVNVSTVYRTLEVLEELGLVRHAHLSDRAPTYHSVRDHEHFHLVCRNCHTVISVGPDVLAPLLDTPRGRPRVHRRRRAPDRVRHLQGLLMSIDAARCSTSPARSPATASTPRSPRTTARSTASSARSRSSTGSSTCRTATSSASRARTG